MIRPSVSAHAIGIFVALMIVCLFSGPIMAQGSIFGKVTAFDGSAPDSGSLLFFGYINGTDEEIHILGSIGTGYDEGNWFDDFQNYLSEAPGHPYAYHFCDTSRNEGYVLSDLIPNNSFQQEDVTLAPVSWPQRPAYLTGRAVDTAHIELRWLYVPGLTYHVYRRDNSSNGSFFRIDDPTGSLDNRGVDNGIYVDSDVDNGVVYSYILISEDGSGRLGMYSDIIAVEANEGTFLRGDANGDGSLNIGDAVFLVNYQFRSGPAPDPPELGEANCDDTPNIGDIVAIINYLYRNWPPLVCP